VLAGRAVEFAQPGRLRSDPLNLAGRARRRESAYHRVHLRIVLIARRPSSSAPGSWGWGLPGGLPKRVARLPFTTAAEAERGGELGGCRNARRRGRNRAR